MNFFDDFFSLQYNNITPSQGKLLISEPFSNDAFFGRSVVLITEHNEDGTIGLILNKKIRNEIKISSKKNSGLYDDIFMGGPVLQDKIFFLHNLGDSIPGSIQIAENIYFGGSTKIIEILDSTGTLDRSNFKHFIGCSTWIPNQLDNELKKNYWLVTDIKDVNILDHRSDIWRECIVNAGGKYKNWQNFPYNPLFN